MALSEYFKSGATLPFWIDDDGYLEEEVEVAILPGYSKSDLDGMWISAINNSRIGCPFVPNENLKRFFEIMNVLKPHHFEFNPVAAEPKYFGDSYRILENKQNAEIINGYFDLLNNFEIDNSRPSLCHPDDATSIMDNATNGGWPLIAGYIKVRDILNLNFEDEIVLDGNFQVGIWDNVNGSGHCESAKSGPFKMKIARGDVIILGTKGWSPDKSCGFVRKYYKLELSNTKETETA
jgi:hypothetical protein